MSRPCFAVIALLALATLAGCAPPAAATAPTSAPTSAPTATPAPTVAPSPTPVPTLAVGSTVFGVDLAGLTLAEAGTKLRASLDAQPTSIDLRAGAARLPIQLAELGLSADADALLAEASAALSTGEPLVVAPKVDEGALRERIAALAAEAAMPATISVISATDVLSRSFAYTPGRSLDIDAAYTHVAAAIDKGEIDTPIELDLAVDEAAPRVPLERLQEEVEALAAEWQGVVGFHFYDIASGATAALHDKTVFAGASTIKVAIMLNLYINAESWSQRIEGRLDKMIIESDNLAANDILAASAGGPGTEWSFIGADEMSTLLQQRLGLENTYLYVPYETVDYIKLYKPKYRCGPKGKVGEPPYTEMGACLRATPFSIAQIYKLIDQCADGAGLLLDEFDKLTPKRCQQMLDHLAENEDTTRMVAGIPAGVRVEHKSGWIADMQADVGVVRSPGGDYIAAIYVYKPLTGGRVLWKDEVMAPVVAAFSRLAYTAYNPVQISP